MKNIFTRGRNKLRPYGRILLFSLFCTVSVTHAAPPNPDGTVPIRPFFQNGTPPTPQFNAPANPGQGIYNHEIWSASSPDALHWTKDGQLIFDHASVPEAAITAKGVIYLYFMDAENGHQMSVAVSSDLGQSWIKHKVEITNRQETNGEAVDPNMVILPDGTFRLFYFGSFGNVRPGQASGLSHIYSALSKDGIHFTEEPGARLSKRGLITDPDAVRTLKFWKLFVSEGRKNIAATSKDGLAFAEDATPASVKGAISKTIAVAGGYRMYRCGQGIESQFSPNLKTWTEEGVRLEPDPGRITCDPTVIQLPDGTYKMYYKTAPLNPPPGQP